MARTGPDRPEARPGPDEIWAIFGPASKWPEIDPKIMKPGLGQGSGHSGPARWPGLGHATTPLNRRQTHRRKTLLPDSDFYFSFCLRSVPAPPLAISTPLSRDFCSR
ncbi:hypothetical protein PIB30_000101 [Stylosanthes scabra]|uniref:Uncharacterized protein n=1 Tax=Stylosanthes scabra TaxID=79078 RepID=A0ABU6R174_9FABA|nr:hypothetical protein [Stylosanthes scabra]